MVKSFWESVKRWILRVFQFGKIFKHYVQWGRFDTVNYSEDSHGSGHNVLSFTLIHIKVSINFLFSRIFLNIQTRSPSFDAKE